MPSIKLLSLLSLTLACRFATGAALQVKGSDPTNDGEIDAVKVLEVVEHQGHGHSHADQGYRDVIIVEEEQFHELEPAVILEEYEHNDDMDFEPDVVTVEEDDHWQRRTDFLHDTVHTCLNFCTNYCETGYFLHQKKGPDTEFVPVDDCDFHKCTADCVVDTAIGDYEEDFSDEAEPEDEGKKYSLPDVRSKMNKRDAIGESNLSSAPSSSDYTNFLSAAFDSLTPLPVASLLDTSLYTNPPFPLSGDGDGSPWLKPANSNKNTPVHQSKGGTAQPGLSNKKNPSSPISNAENADEVYLSGVCGRLPSRVDGTPDGNLKKYYFANEGMEVVVHRSFQSRRRPGKFQDIRKPSLPDAERDRLDVGNSKLLRDLRTLVCV
ncbi:hypothetical protein QBC42DRAFT_287747 [Cladorrhinum samala]|uniref:Uncharacterized protein n=1 Tax=Cladorrhinum samala TaxID=585594 RepID=A0AAV9HQH8_9PEZI|nr:hypothetical protein QBC42DRAFT_287747 [Cladorrhinum samala]